MQQPLILCFTRPDIEEGNLRPFLRRFGKEKLPRGKKLRRMMGTFSLWVDGYNTDPREVYVIEEVRSFYAALHKEWPFILYFADLRTDTLRIFAASLAQNVECGSAIGNPLSYLSMDPQETILLFKNSFPAMNDMMERAGFSGRENYNRTAALFAYFDFPFEVPPP